MPRTPLARLAQRIHAGCAEERLARPTRARFLAGATATLAATPIAVRAARRPRVVIVGAGVAGLCCAYRLAQAGIPSRVFEASNRIAGRTWTLRGFFAEGQIAEHGGEFISIGHHAARRLAAELGLELVNLNKLETGVDTYYFNGARYTIAEAKADYARVYDAIHEAERLAGYPTTYKRSTPTGRALDRMSVVEWIEQNVPGGTASRLGQLLSVACETENGGNASAQSALNLIYLLGFEKRGRFNLAGSLEALHVEGGNDQLATRMAVSLPHGSIEAATALVALRDLSNGSYRCTFESGSRTFDVDADHVCLAIPFTTLRRVDLRRVDLAPLKRLAIARLPMGTNAKLHLQFGARIWKDQGYNGATWTQFPYQTSWDVSAGQAGDNGILVGYAGGRHGIFPTAPHGPAPYDIASDAARQLDTVYPGIARTWTGAAYLDVWARDPWHLGSYSYYGVGDYTTFAGIEGVRERNVHFAGEQTSYDFQGYINGAVVSGERTAREILEG